MFCPIPESQRVSSRVGCRVVARSGPSAKQHEVCERLQVFPGLLSLSRPQRIDRLAGRALQGRDCALTLDICNNVPSCRLLVARIGRRSSFSGSLSCFSSAEMLEHRSTMHGDSLHILQGAHSFEASQSTSQCDPSLALEGQRISSVGFFPYPLFK